MFVGGKQSRPAWQVYPGIRLKALWNIVKTYDLQLGLEMKAESTCSVSGCGSSVHHIAYGQAYMYRIVGNSHYHIAYEFAYMFQIVARQKSLSHGICISLHLSDRQQSVLMPYYYAVQWNSEGIGWALCVYSWGSIPGQNVVIVIIISRNV
jgi:hypothetical protein